MLFSYFWVARVAEIANLSIISDSPLANLGMKNEENFNRTFMCYGSKCNGG